MESEVWAKVWNVWDGNHNSGFFINYVTQGFCITGPFSVQGGLNVSWYVTDASNAPIDGANLTIYWATSANGPFNKMIPLIVQDKIANAFQNPITTGYWNPAHPHGMAVADLHIGSVSRYYFYVVVQYGTSVWYWPIASSTKPGDTTWHPVAASGTPSSWAASGNGFGNGPTTAYPTQQPPVLHPGISVSKTGPTYAHEGDTTTYTITVTNPLSATMYKVSVSDSLLGDLTASFSASLAPGASESKIFTYSVPTPSGDVTNTVTVKYKDALNTEKTDTRSWTVDILHPKIDVTKSGPTCAHEGDLMTYTITVTNTGDCPLIGVSMTDPTLAFSWTGDLDTGAFQTFTVSYTVPQPSTVISNIVTATGSDILGGVKGTVSDTASWTVSVIGLPVGGESVPINKPSPSVGGEWVLTNKLEPLAPWISLALMMSIAASFVGIRRFKKNKRQD